MSHPYGLDDDSMVIDMEPDVDYAEERLWELYKEQCYRRGEHPSIKDYLVWLSENYV